MFDFLRRLTSEPQKTQQRQERRTPQQSHTPQERQERQEHQARGRDTVHESPVQPQRAAVASDGLDTTGADTTGVDTWREQARRDRDQRTAEPGYGGAGYYGSSEDGGQSFNSAQRLYPGDPGYREHPTRDTASARIGAGRQAIRNGPKNYERADARIRDDLCDRLAMHGALDVAEVTVDVEGGIVKLAGTVGDRYEKRQIEDIAANVFGVNDVENHIRVAPHRDGADRLDASERVLNRS